MKRNNYKQQTIDLYKGLGWKSLFSNIRFWDAPLVELEEYIPKEGLVTELGCGDGVLSNYIALTSNKRIVIGIDNDKKRISTANQGIKNTKYIHGDIRTIPIPKSDVIIISHVLHHLSSYQEQVAVLERCKKYLNSGGQIIILEIYIESSLKYALGWFFDHFLVPIFFEKRLYSKIYYRKKNEWKNTITSLGFDVEINNLTAGKPISNIIIICNA